MTNELQPGAAPAGRTARPMDRSSLALILSNVFTLLVAVVGGWTLADLMWIYWGQSVVIGYYNWQRIRLLQDFSTENFQINDQSVEPTPATRRQVATFFAVHYGFFHLAYLVFLLGEGGRIGTLDMLATLVCVGLFAANHRYSFQYNLAQDLARKPNIGTVMFFPYARIIPMHITIVSAAQFAGESTASLLFFIGLKTLADWIMHVIEHRQPRAAATGR